MPKIPGVSQRDAVRVFQKLGYRIVRQTGHIIMSNGEVRLTSPRHSPINVVDDGCDREGRRSNAGRFSRSSLTFRIASFERFKMSDEAIIRVENLGKRYSLRHLRDQRYVARLRKWKNAKKHSFLRSPQTMESRY